MDSVNCTSAISSWATLRVVLIVVDKEIKKYFGNPRILWDFCVHISDIFSFSCPFGRGIWFLVFWGCNALKKPL